MLEDSSLVTNATRGLSSAHVLSCIKISNQATGLIRVDTPMTGWIGGNLKITTLYSSDGDTGNFLVKLNGAAYNLDDVVPMSFSAPSVSIPTTLGVIKKYEETVTTYSGTGILAPEYLTITFRRSGANLSDTSNDTMEWLAMEIEYDVAG